METGTRRTWLRRVVFGLVAVALLGVLTYLLVYALRGWDLAEIHRNGPAPDTLHGARNLLPPAIAAVALALCALFLWWLEFRRSPEEAEQVSERLSDELERARERSAALERSRQMLAEWNRELRRELRELHRNAGVLGGDEGVEDLLLRMSMQLTDASKGLLFARADGGDGLEVVAHAGFEDPDPHDSWLVRRFADEVIERDEIVREDFSGREGDGPDDIQNLVAVPVYVSDEFSGVVVCANSDSFGSHDDEVLIALGDHAGAVLENTRLHGELRETYVDTVDMLAEAIRAKDPHLGGHSREVSEYVHRVARRLGLDAADRERLVFGSLLHDIGKIGISERILLKPSSLTDEEYTVIKLHPKIGSRLVEQVAALAPLAPAVLLHHERWDGGGYPSGLKGEEIPLEARVIGVADAFSAMTSDRPYRGRMSLGDACAELERCAGTQFDPEVVRLFVDEVRADPPDEDHDPVAEAMDDPEIRARRDGDDLLLGRGPLELIDPLTLLYGHRYFHEAASAEADRAAVQGSPFSVIVVEIAGLPHVNDDLGYAAGDAAIQGVAHAIQLAAVRVGGTAARISGRRLALLLPEADDTAAADCLAELRTALVHGPEVLLGAATWRSGEDGDAVIERARRFETPAPVA